MASMVKSVSAVLNAFPMSSENRLKLGLLSNNVVRSCSRAMFPPGVAVPYCCGPAASLSRSVE